MLDADPPLLIARAREGDDQAWDALVARYAGLVWSVARAHRLGHADAADVAQTTWTKLVEHLDRLQEPAAIGGWLATTARRECLRLIRQAERTTFHDGVPEIADETPGLDAGLLVSERDAELWNAFSRLGPRDQALLRMLTAEPAPSYQEISAALGMPVGSIGPTRARALERLRRELAR
jgi:RNA polymerase sigma factor (sigma-70 family)